MGEMDKKREGEMENEREKEKKRERRGKTAERVLSQLCRDERFWRFFSAKS